MFSTALPALVATAVSVAALTINTPANWKGNITNVVTWTSTTGDPTAFTVELVHQQFNPNIGVANNVQTSLGSVGIPLPRLEAGPGFTLEFVDVSNIGNVFATSAPFSIAENDIEGASSSASASSVSAASTAPGTPGGPISSASLAPSGSGGSSVTAPGTTPTISVRPSSTNSAAQTSNTDTTTPTTSNTAASGSSTGGALRSTSFGSPLRAFIAAIIGMTLIAN